jgi:microcystin-dependent protein
MKSKLLLLSFLMLLTVATNYAQGSSRGISVQGIARDGNNNARAAATLQLKFSLYYTTASTVNTLVTITQELTTDAFGVFSYVIPAAAIDNTTLLENELYLKIEQLIGGVANPISNEQLNYVPYAMSASNGVPTGSIMPYMGVTAPVGWALCDGNVLPSTATVLIAMVGTVAPDLRGMFLRGAGTSAITEYASNNKGPNLKERQGDGFKEHLHTANANGLKTSEAGLHNHKNGDYKYLLRSDNYNTATGTDTSTGQPDLVNKGEMSDNGNHTHAITGSTDNTGINETRPVNYGVNYIIKL